MEGGQSWDVKPESGGTCGPKGSPKALLGRPWDRGAPTKLIFFRFFLLIGSTGGFGLFFLFLSVSLLLSFDHLHFLSSCLAHRLPPCTNFCIHLSHIPTHPHTSPLCMLRLVLTPKTLLFPQDACFLVANQALELLLQREWNGLSRWISLRRFPPIPTTCLNY